MKKKHFGYETPLSTPRRSRVAAIPGIAFCAVLLTGIGGCATTAPERAAHLPSERTIDWSSKSGESLGESDRLIVVTFESRSRRGLSNPGSTASRYRGTPGTYKALPTSLKTSNQLARSYGIVAVDDWPIAMLDVHCVVFSVPGSAPIGSLIERMEGDARIKTVQRLHEFEVLGRYDDPYLPHQSGLQTMRIEDAHAWATGEGVKIAIIDTGVDLAHPDLSLTISAARDCVSPPPSGRCRDELRFEDHSTFSGDPHGTAVAGVIASTAGNGQGIVGVAPGAKVLALKACWYREDGAASAVCNTFTLAKAIQVAVDEGADILNLSLTGPSDPLLHDLVEKTIERGAIVVGAVRKRTNQEAPGFPACHHDVITVGTMIRSEPPLPSSLPGPSGAKGTGAPSPLFAPGENVLTTQPGGTYDFVTGSSFAAAHVSGLAALLLEHDRVPRRRLYEILQRTSDRSGGVNACDAVAELMGHPPCSNSDPR